MTGNVLLWIVIAIVVASAAYLGTSAVLKRRPPAGASTPKPSARPKPAPPQSRPKSGSKPNPRAGTRPKAPAPRPDRSQPPAATKPGGAAAGRPQPGEIWWADVPYEDGTGHKVRPCLVLRNQRNRIDVLKITSQDQSDRDDHVQIPTRDWDRNAEHDSWLDLTGPFELADSAFSDRAGTIDKPTWQKVTRLHETGAMAN